MATTHPVRYLLELGERTYDLREVHGEESLSRPFRFELVFHVEPDDELDPDTVVDATATLVLSATTEERRIEGVVTEVSRGATRREATALAGLISVGRHGAARVRVVLEARLATARHRVDIRVFRDKTAPEIVTEVLAAHGVGVERRLANDYVRRPYCVQMRESDLDFAARLLEDEGIFYACMDAGAGVVLGDAVGSYDASVGELPFKGATGLDGGRRALAEVGWIGEATAGKVSLRDFNFERPSDDMDVSAPGPTAWGPEWYDYPGEYETPTEGRAKARLRAEALACRKERLAARAFAADLRPGVLFELTEEPHGVRGGSYVVTSLRHAWRRSDDGFSVRLEALPARVVHRPPVATPVPTLVNPLTGFVTGPADADIHTEAWGRVKVHFPWDRLQPKDDRCSHWVPVLQDNTGHSASVPRVGWEVLCHFQEGDPDRPVVLGRVFNGDDPFTEELPKRKSRTSLQSMSSPRNKEGATGFNMIRFEDAAGNQAIDVHAEKDQNVVVANDQLEQIDAGESITVGGNETVTIGNLHDVNVTRSWGPRVDGNQTVTIAGSRSAKIGTRQLEAVTRNHTLTIGGSHARRVAKQDQLDVAKNLTETVAGLDLEASIKSNSRSAGRASVLAVGGAIVEIARLGKSEGASKARAETVGGLYFTKSSKETLTRVEKTRRTTVGGFYQVDANGEILLAGLTSFTARAKTASFEAPSITLQVGETIVHLKDGTIDVKSKEIVMETTAQNKQGAATSSQA